MWTTHPNGAKVGFELLLEQIEQDKQNAENAEIEQKIKELCNTLDPSGDSLLHYAAQYGNKENTKYLINLGCKINLQSNDGNTPLLLATKQQRVTIIQTLLEFDANIYICDNEGVNALQVALLTNPIDVEVAKLFLQHLSSKCLSHSTEIARRLMEIKCPIYIAVLLGNVDVTTCMINGGCEIDSKDSESGRTALHFAVENVDFEHVDKLISLGANVNARNLNDKLPLAVLNDFKKSDEAFKIVQILITKTKLSCDYRNVFMQLGSILHYGTAEIVKIVVKTYLGNVQARDQDNRNIIHYLAKNCNPGIVDVIKPGFFNIIRCKKGLANINVNECDKNGLTALHYAMSVGNINFVKYLIKRNANLYIENKNGFTPFLEAVDSRSGHRLRQRVQCIHIFMMKKAKPDICMGNYFKIYNSDSDIELDYILLKPVIEMFALWKADKRPFNQAILHKMYSYRKLKEYFDCCTSELNKMKNERIGYKKVTLFCVLVQNDHYKSASCSANFKSLTRDCLRELTEKHNSIQIYHEILRKYAYPKNDSNDVMFICLLVFVVLLLSLKSLLSHYQLTRDYENRIAGNSTKSS